MTRPLLLAATLVLGAAGSVLAQTPSPAITDFDALCQDWRDRFVSQADLDQWQRLSKNTTDPRDWTSIAAAICGAASPDQPDCFSAEEMQREMNRRDDEYTYCDQQRDRRYRDYNDR